MPPIQSKAITNAEYDPSTQQLHLTFTSGGTYTFFAVPESVYTAFLASSSKGTFYNTYIREKYVSK
ncbi:KTSC domain-containing protein [Brucella sp. IR073]|uniref:KTSC domain-containing protein n=1 Tax=unclassified Brucella TaxID=2632610 RepID=UPI003B97F7E4